MKATCMTILAGATVLALHTANAGKLHAKLHYKRYLKEREATLAEVTEYLKSPAYKFAVDNGIWTPKDEDRDGEPSEDTLQRFAMTKQGLSKLERANPDAEFSLESPFSLLTDDEFARYVNPTGGNITMAMSTPPANIDVSPHEKQRSKDCSFEVDWKEKGCVSAVKNQGQCGSCWAFATVAAIESAECIKGQELNSYSEQQLMTCDTARNKACNGGSPILAMEFIKKTGLCNEADAPYTGVYGGCAACTPVKKNLEIKVLEDKTDAALANAVRQQPVTILVAAANNAWKQYKSGILSSCETSALDHAVLVYGFSNDAYLVKNSWGKVWGEEGFLKLARNPSGSGTCSMYESMAYPQL